MNKKFKKLSLKIEYLTLELEEVEELSKKYLKEFDKEFYDEMCFLNSSQKQGKNLSQPPNPPNTQTQPLIQKIYRNLAKILHPDVSQLENAEEEYKKVTKCYDNHDLVGLLTLSNAHQIELPELSDDEYLKIDDAIKDTEMKIKSNQTTLAWMSCNSQEDKELLKQKVYKMINLNQEEYEKWKMEVAGVTNLPPLGSK